jgi:phosphoenolpyruvate---glycerone phosphotransferase subunit DhaL
MSESRSITSTELREMLASVGETLAKEEPYLNSLDAAIGDGDHGITMRVGFQAIASKLRTLPDGTGIGVILKQAGTAFMGATGGAIGILLGRMLIAGGTALEPHQEIGPAEFRMVLAATETALSSAGKAQPGDKTILDAVHAANQAVSASDDSPQDLLVLIRRASEAAKNAAQNTAQMVARVGRSSRLGDRVLGHPDPGAVSFSIILRAMSEWLESHPQGRP